MCGISGAIGFIDDSVVEAVARMNRTQTHRGPDSFGSWRTSEAPGTGVAFAHRRLSIIDLSSKAAQPMRDDQTGNVIVYNGEIYNFRMLRSRLKEAGASFASDSDTEVLLKAYNYWGDACVKMLRGMFAFAIWDATKRQVLLARDPVGIKPLYISMVEVGARAQCMLFASEVRSLLSSGYVERKADPVGLAGYMWNGFVPGPATLVSGVRNLPAGTTITVSLDDMSQRESRFWSIPKVSKATCNTGDLAQVLRDSVAMRLVGDVPIGVFLSGGVDSSAIAAIAASSSSERIRTFSIGFEEPSFDESPYARAVASHIGSDHTEITLNQAMFRSQLADALESIDQPTCDQINTYFISRAVREAGITVALAGTGGDELFGGYRSFRLLPRLRRVARFMAWLPRPVVQLVCDIITRVNMGRHRGIRPQVRWGKLEDLINTHGNVLDMYQVSYGLFRKDFHSELLSNNVPTDQVYGLPRQLYDRLESLVEGQPHLHAISIMELAMYVGERLVRDCDAASMAVSLELRVPLLDHRLIEIMSSVDEKQRYRPIISKRLLRKIALSDVPPSIFNREKSGFVVPLEHWIRRGISDDIDRTLRDEHLCATIGLDEQLVRRLWCAYCDGARGVHWSRIWTIFILLSWIRRHEITL